MKLKQIRGVKQVEGWMVHHICLAGTGYSEFLASRVFMRQLQCPLADILDGWLAHMMEAGWLVHWLYG